MNLWWLRKHLSLWMLLTQYGTTPSLNLRTKNKEVKWPWNIRPRLKSTNFAKACEHSRKQSKLEETKHRLSTQKSKRSREKARNSNWRVFWMTVVPIILLTTDLAVIITILVSTILWVDQDYQDCIVTTTTLETLFSRINRVCTDPTQLACLRLWLLELVLKRTWCRNCSIRPSTGKTGEVDTLLHMDKIALDLLWAGTATMVLATTTVKIATMMNSIMVTPLDLLDDSLLETEELDVL